MTSGDEAKIRREGFPINRTDAKALLDFINLYNPSHSAIEAEIIVKLEVLSGKYWLTDGGNADVAK